MHPRPIRSQIYLPVVRFGVVDSDWKFVIFITLLCYSIPFLFNLKILNFPIEIWSTLLGLILSVVFFNFVRMGRKPFWLQHTIAAYTRSSRQRHTLPTDPKKPAWLLPDEKE